MEAVDEFFVSEDPGVASAKHLLGKALEKQDVHSLKNALQGAKYFGLKGPDVDRVEKLVLGIECQKSLAAALRTKKLPQLRSALEEARTAGSQSPQVAQVQALLEKLEAQDSLAIAMESKEFQVLHDAIEKAKQAGVDWVRIKTASTLEARLHAKRELDTAVASGDNASISTAIQKAKLVGVSRRDAESAEKLLVKQRRCREVVDSKLTKELAELPKIEYVRDFHNIESLLRPKASSPSYISMGHPRSRPMSASDLRSQSTSPVSKTSGRQLVPAEPSQGISQNLILALGGLGNRSRSSPALL